MKTAKENRIMGLVVDAHNRKLEGKFLNDRDKKYSSLHASMGLEKAVVHIIENGLEPSYLK